MSRRKRKLDCITDLHGCQAPMDVVPPPPVCDTSVQTPIQISNDSRNPSPGHPVRMQTKAPSGANNRNGMNPQRRFRKGSENSAPGLPMTNRMQKGILSTFPADPLSHYSNINKHIYPPIFQRSLRQPKSSPKAQPDKASPNSHANERRLLKGPPRHSKSKQPVSRPSCRQTTHPNVETRPVQTRRRQTSSVPDGPHNAVGSAILPDNVRNSRMTGAQRMKQMSHVIMQTPKRNSPRNALETKKSLPVRHSREKESVSEVIDLDAEPQVQQISEDVEGELVSNSEDESLHISDESDGALLANLKKPPCLSSIPDGKENRPDFIDLSHDEPPRPCRLKKRNRSLPPSTKEPHSECPDSETRKQSEDFNTWKKVSEPLKTFDPLEAVERVKTDDRMDKSVQANDSDVAKIANGCGAISVSVHVNDSEHHSRAEYSGTDPRTICSGFNAATNRISPRRGRRLSQLSSYRKEKAMNIESTKRHYLRNITSSLTGRVHPPHGDTGKNPADTAKHNNVAVETQRGGTNILSVSVRKDRHDAQLEMKDSGPRRTCKNIRLEPLTNDELMEVRAVTRGVRKQEPLVFVKEANIMLKGEDLARLRGCRWLNDEVMNSFVALINARNDKHHKGNEDVIMTDENIVAEKQSHEPVDKSDKRLHFCEIFKKPRPRIHAFNTFFFARLTQGDMYDYRGVRRWLRRAGKDIRTLDLILVPINLSQFHWVLAAIDIRHCQFLYFDSTFGLDTADALGILKRWLSDEANDKGCQDFLNKEEILEWRTVINPTYMPHQRDSGSCGVFTLYLAEYLERGVRPDFEQKHVQTLRQRTVLFLKKGELPD